MPCRSGLSWWHGPIATTSGSKRLPAFSMLRSNAGILWMSGLKPPSGNRLIFSRSATTSRTLLEDSILPSERELAKLNALGR
ncbi:Os01g0564532 [Oryza sativa Japonica Group]|uniref:Os01g0564532 protein n=1 Tax=Oryza sativa subsp. japonica TaxID=39947 RepID=A0A0P0V459_ORYSJ|nr:hypothetical protein EE612_003515 [Oryza sativa]BAS72744.1 Os01g0564532 [Oryza sativa Japonica Group]